MAVILSDFCKILKLNIQKSNTFQEGARLCKKQLLKDKTMRVSFIAFIENNQFWIESPSIQYLMGKIKQTKEIKNHPRPELLKPKGNPFRESSRELVTLETTNRAGLSTILSHYIACNGLFKFVREYVPLELISVEDLDRAIQNFFQAFDWENKYRSASEILENTVHDDGLLKNIVLSNYNKLVIFICEASDLQKQTLVNSLTVEDCKGIISAYWHRANSKESPSLNDFKPNPYQLTKFGYFILDLPSELLVSSLSALNNPDISHESLVSSINPNLQRKVFVLMDMTYEGKQANRILSDSVSQLGLRDIGVRVFNAMTQALLECNGYAKYTLTDMIDVFSGYEPNSNPVVNNVLTFINRVEALIDESYAT